MEGRRFGSRPSFGGPREMHKAVCSECKKECEVETVCATCHGEGEYSIDESDVESHMVPGVGTQRCHCQNRDDDDRQDE